MNAQRGYGQPRVQLASSRLMAKLVTPGHPGKDNVHIWVWPKGLVTRLAWPSHSHLEVVFHRPFLGSYQPLIVSIFWCVSSL